VDRTTLGGGCDGIRRDRPGHRPADGDDPVAGLRPRDPTTWWAWPVLAVTSVLSGLLFATYVREPGGQESGEASINRGGAAGGLLAFFAVGCPVCNKLALIALGYTGALQWFAPVQPFLGVAAIGLLAWALRARLRGQLACSLPAAPPNASAADLPTGKEPARS
jgi:hypothetical protein